MPAKGAHPPQRDVFVCLEFVVVLGERRPLGNDPAVGRFDGIRACLFVVVKLLFGTCAETLSVQAK